MRQSMAVVLALALGVVGCCFRCSSPEAEPMSQPRGTAEIPPKNSILLDVAVIERPVGDYFLNHELWNLGHEQCIDLEMKPLLQANGLRVGLIGGLLPPRLHAMLKSPRTCPNPRRLYVQPDEPALIRENLGAGKIAFTLHKNGEPQAIDLHEAQCQFEVCPSIEGEEVRLRFTPRVKHGQAKIEPRVAHDPDGARRWSVEARESFEQFPHLSWEMVVSPKEYVLIGARLEEANTLGTAFFLTANGRVQKIVVLRAVLLSSESLDETLTQSPPLALQASWTARGSGE